MPSCELLITGPTTSSAPSAIVDIVFGIDGEDCTDGAHVECCLATVGCEFANDVLIWVGSIYAALTIYHNTKTAGADICSH